MAAWSASIGGAPGQALLCVAVLHAILFSAQAGDAISNATTPLQRPTDAAARVNGSLPTASVAAVPWLQPDNASDAAGKPLEPEPADLSVALGDMVALTRRFEGKNLTTDTAAAAAQAKYLKLFNAYRYARASKAEPMARVSTSATKPKLAKPKRKINEFIYPKSDGTGFSYRKKDQPRRFYFVGTNIYDLAYMDSYTESQIMGLLQESYRQGLRVMRMWCFRNGYGEYEGYYRPNPLQSSPGIYKKNAFKRMDFVLDQAARAGIRIICVLSQNWKDFGGADWYVNKTVGGDREKFFHDSTVKAYFKSYVSYVLNRKNVYNGLRYKDDPAIFSWQLINEPHLEGYEARKGWPVGSTLRSWVCEMSTYVRSIDSKHMISAGDEGYRIDGRTDVPTLSWVNGGSKGVDFVGNLACGNISYAKVHYWPQAWGIPAWNASYWPRDFFADRAKAAKRLKKPIVLEEYGMMEGYGITRHDLFESIYKTALYNGFAGLVTWEVMPSWLKPVGNPTLFDYDDDGAQSIKNQVNWVKKKNNKKPVDTPAPPEGPCTNNCQPWDASKCQPTPTEYCQKVTSNGTNCWPFIAGYCRALCKQCLP